MAQLQGKGAVVTGAGSGIGRAAALLFAKEGASVLAVDCNEAGVTETVERIRAAGGRGIAVAADAGSEAEVTGFMAKATEAFGAVDVLYANAGISGGSVPFLESTAEQWQAVLRVNLIGTFLAVRTAARHMVERGRGSIVCTASVAGLRANAAGAPYSASKAGVISLVQTAANALIGTGVRVNAVCPGLIETGMTRDLFERARARGTQDKVGQLNPLQRAGQPEEIARMALFLASDASSYVNGQAIAADGGLSSTLPFVTRPAHPASALSHHLNER